MNDINWRSFEDQKSWDLLNNNPNRRIIVQTDIGIRISTAQNIEELSNGVWLNGDEECAIKFAFIG
jgi:hypothetical protein